MIITKFKDYSVTEGFATVPVKDGEAADDQHRGVQKKEVKKDQNVDQKDQKDQKKVIGKKSTNDKNLPEAPAVEEEQREKIS